LIYTNNEDSPNEMITWYYINTSHIHLQYPIITSVLQLPTVRVVLSHVDLTAPLGRVSDGPVRRQRTRLLIHLW